MRTKFPALIMAVALAATVAISCTDANDAAPDSTQTLPDQQESSMEVHLNIEGAVLTATLDDNATSRDFISLLPLTLTLEDYASTEKISMLPKRLSTEGAPAG
jgi:hypothetical protein